MNVYKAIVVFILVLCPVTDVYGIERNVRPPDSSFSGMASEKMLTKLSHLQETIAELGSAMKQVELKLFGDVSKLSGEISKLSQRMDKKLSGVVGVIGEQNRTTAQILLVQQDHLTSVKKQGESIEQKINGVANQMRHNVSALQAQSGRIEHTVNVQHEQLAKEMQKLASKEDLAWFNVDPDRYYRSISIPSCKKKLTYPTGKYMIQPTKEDAPFLGYCDQTLFGGGWLVFQYRYDGSIDFFRNWTEYRNGFGCVDGEFWLGMERLHRLTSAPPHELLVELKDFKGKYSYARYEMFQIGSEKEKYALKVLGEHTGTADDSLVQHRGHKFSTVDRDNDGWSSVNCASDYNGAWRYWHCAHSNLNGRYRNSNDRQSMYWARAGNVPYAYSRMSIREK